MALRAWRAAVMSSLVVLVNVAAIAPAVLATPTQARTGGVTVRIVWANLQRQDSALQAIVDLARSQRADILALTELPNGGVAAVQTLFPEARCITEIVGPQTPFSTVIASRKPCALRGYSQELPRPSDAVFVDVGDLRVAAIHPRPPWNNERTADRDAVIRAGLRAALGRPSSVFVGDFNATPWAHIADEVQRAGFRRAQCGSFLAPTWRSRWPLLGLPIDHVYLSDGVELRSCAIGRATGSDHWPLVVEVAMPHQ